jgi:hypothetical protein
MDELPTKRSPADGPGEEDVYLLILDLSFVERFVSSPDELEVRRRRVRLVLIVERA